jgi:hypothetical protein
MPSIHRPDLFVRTADRRRNSINDRGFENVTSLLDTSIVAVRRSGRPTNFAYPKATRTMKARCITLAVSGMLRSSGTALPGASSKKRLDLIAALRGPDRMLTNGEVFKKFMTMVTHANGTAERRAAEIMLNAKSKAAGRRITVGEDKAHDTADHVANPRANQRDTTRDTNRQDPQQRHRRTNHAASGNMTCRITPGDDRMHLRLGQAARDHAQGQKSRHWSRRR